MSTRSSHAAACSRGAGTKGLGPAPGRRLTFAWHGGQMHSQRRAAQKARRNPWAPSRATLHRNCHCSTTPRALSCSAAQARPELSSQRPQLGEPRASGRILLEKKRRTKAGTPWARSGERKRASVPPLKDEFLLRLLRAPPPPGSSWAGCFEDLRLQRDRLGEMEKRRRPSERQPRPRRPRVSARERLNGASKTPERNAEITNRASQHMPPRADSPRLEV